MVLCRIIFFRRHRLSDRHRSNGFRLRNHRRLNGYCCLSLNFRGLHPMMSFSMKKNCFCCSLSCCGSNLIGCRASRLNFVLSYLLSKVCCSLIGFVGAHILSLSVMDASCLARCTTDGCCLKMSFGERWCLRDRQWLTMGVSFGHLPMDGCCCLLDGCSSMGVLMCLLSVLPWCLVDGPMKLMLLGGHLPMLLNGLTCFLPMLHHCVLWLGSADGNSSSQVCCCHLF